MPETALPVRRYAAYWTPPSDHVLWRAGCAWLGRDAERGVLQPSRDDRRQACRYGFHATLKPPIRLRPQAVEHHVRSALEELAAARQAFEMPRLEVAMLGDFLALRPADPQAITAEHPLRRLADDCVRRLDPFRALPSAAETARRCRPGLSNLERANLARWGYPQVFESWRFHMTLTDGLAEDLPDACPRQRLLREAREHFREALATPLVCDQVALFVEDAPGADLMLERRYAFAR